MTSRPALPASNPDPEGFLEEQILSALFREWCPGIHLRPQIERGVFVSWQWEANVSKLADGRSYWGKGVASGPGEALRAALANGVAQREAFLAEREATAAAPASTLEDLGL